MNALSPAEQTDTWLYTFEKSLTKNDANSASKLFQKDCYWRDLVVFTWNIKTSEGQTEIADMLSAVVSKIQPSNWKRDGDPTVKDGVIECWITFETRVAQGRGQVRLIDGKCWTLLTTMKELKGHEEKKGRNRERGSIHGAFKDRKSWQELKSKKEARLGYEDQPYCVIVGGGQGGIALGARLQRLGVPLFFFQ